MKTRGGWRETAQAHQIDLAVRDLSSVSDEELLRIVGYSLPNVAPSAGKTLTLEPVHRPWVKKLWSPRVVERAASSR